MNKFPKTILILLTFVILLLICIFFIWKANKSSNLTISKNYQNTTNKEAVKVITENLTVPWGIAILPDNRMLVTERGGDVKIVDKNGNVSESPAANIKVFDELTGEDGLLGITLHPNFYQNHFVYLYYTYQSNGQSFNRVVRMDFDDDKLINEKVIVDKIPAAIFHDGGRIKFGPDDFLYITTGDARNSALAQDKNSLAGKILRVTDEGKAAPGNPFNNLVYSYGHRNPQGLAWDASGNLWETEHGRSNPTGYDEVNYIEKGRNYGWEVIQGDQEKQGMVTPKRNSGPSNTWAPSGAVFIGNSFFFAGLKGEALYEAVIEDNNIIDFKEHFKGEFGRLRDVVVGNDGMLYLTTSNRDGRGNSKVGDDKIIRVNPNSL